MPRPKALWGTVTYEYDKNGNQTKMVVQGKGKKEETTSFGYDYENRLTQIGYDDGTTSEYVYDGVGKRIQANEQGRITNYLYDGLNVIIERDQHNITRASYTRGLGYGGGIGSIISRTSYQSPVTSYYFHYDGIGAVTGLTDSTGNVIQNYTYDAYGNILSAMGSAVNPYRFSTKEYNPTAGLIYFGARYYDPRIGRFITKDLFPGNIYRPYDHHKYSYCSNNPINYVDPLGLIKRDAQGKIIANPTGNVVSDIYGVQWKEYELRSDKGNPIKAYRPINPPNSNWNYDCHGKTFVDSEYWINDDQVRKILNDDGYISVNQPQIGDVVVYRNAQGQIIHTGRVSSVTQNGQVMIDSKWGRLPERTHWVNESPYGTNITYYRKQ